MAIDYLLGEDGDIAITNGRITLTETIEQSSKQQATISLNTYRGEWDFNILAGIPYLANENNPIQVLGISTKKLIDAVIQKDILERENITELISFTSELDPTTRQLNIKWEARTNEGSTIQSSTTV